MAKANYKTVHELVDSWTRDSRSNLDWLSRLELLQLLSDELFSQYQPYPESPDFIVRLSSWLSNVNKDSDRKQLFELATWLLFVGSEEMLTLYRSSFRDEITRWIIDQAKIDIGSRSANEEIGNAFKETFFGSIAGMDIGSFCRVNGIQQSIRPDFREHALIGKPNSLTKYLKDRYKRIVAVEDFVGSGSQMTKAHSYLSQLKSYPVLLCPMIVSPKGAEVGRTLGSGNISFSPVFCIPEELSISRKKNKKILEPPIFEKIRMVLESTYSKVKSDNPTDKYSSPFGFPAPDGTGALLLTYLNCPNNVPPAVHHKSESWEPLFRRSSREG